MAGLKLQCVVKEWEIGRQRPKKFCAWPFRLNTQLLSIFQCMVRAIFSSRVFLPCYFVLTASGQLSKGNATINNSFSGIR